MSGISFSELLKQVVNAVNYWDRGSSGAVASADRTVGAGGAAAGAGVPRSVEMVSPNNAVLDALAHQIAKERLGFASAATPQSLEAAANVNVQPFIDEARRALQLQREKSLRVEDLILRGSHSDYEAGNKIRDTPGYLGNGSIDKTGIEKNYQESLDDLDELERLINEVSNEIHSLKRRLQSPASTTAIGRSFDRFTGSDPDSLRHKNFRLLKVQVCLKGALLGGLENAYRQFEGDNESGRSQTTKLVTQSQARLNRLFTHHLFTKPSVQTFRANEAFKRELNRWNVFFETAPLEDLRAYLNSEQLAIGHSPERLNEAFWNAFCFPLGTESWHMGSTLAQKPYVPEGAAASAYDQRRSPTMELLVQYEALSTPAAMKLGVALDSMCSKEREIVTKSDREWLPEYERRKKIREEAGASATTAEPPATPAPPASECPVVTPFRASDTRAFGDRGAGSPPSLGW